MKKGAYIIIVIQLLLLSKSVSAQSETVPWTGQSGDPVVQLSGSSEINSGLPEVRKQKDFFFYASGLTGYRMPISLTSSYGEAVRCEGAGFGFGAGYNYSFYDKWSYNPGLHVTTIYYSDWRVTNRPLSTIMVDVADFGYVLSEKKIPVRVNANIGAGLMFQYNYNDSDLHENLGKSEFQVRAGFTVRVGLPGNFVVKALIEGYTLAADREPIPLYLDASNGAPNNRGFQAGLGIEYNIDLFRKKASR